MNRPPSFVRRIIGYIFAVVFIIAGWWITALIVNSPALPTPALAPGAPGPPGV